MLPSLVDGTQPSRFSVDADVGVSAGRLYGEFRTQTGSKKSELLSEEAAADLAVWFCPRPHCSLLPFTHDLSSF